jgi:hypothetical protein
MSRKIARLELEEAPAAPGAGPAYRLDSSGKSVIALSGLFSDRECQPEQASGKIVKRGFDASGMKLTSFVIEDNDGSRQLVNIDIGTDTLDMATKGRVLRGLQVLLTEGRSAQIVVKRCGAAGRVLMLEAVR